MVAPCNRLYSTIGTMDLPRSFTIRESSHRIHNPFTSDNLATLGHALSPRPGTRMLDLACGTGEMLCTWAADRHLPSRSLGRGSGRTRADRQAYHGIRRSR